MKYSIFRSVDWVASTKSIMNTLRRSWSPFASWSALALGVIALGNFTFLAAGETAFDIGVRAEVERANKGLGREPLREHGKAYIVISLQQLDNISDELTHPVNEFKLLKELRNALASRGFHEVSERAQADILITVLYGRGWLRNPYLDDGMLNELSGVPILTLTGVDAVKHMVNAREVGEEKIQRAQAEKLIINLTAWKPPAKHKEKPKELWRTTIYVEDADQDLNILSEKMLMAGAAYFDRQLDKEEVTLPSTLPEGRVDVGTPTVVTPSKEK